MTERAAKYEYALSCKPNARDKHLSSAISGTDRTAQHEDVNAVISAQSKVTVMHVIRVRDRISCAILRRSCTPPSCTTPCIVTRIVCVYVL